MLSVDEAHAVANTWRPRFADPDAFVTSWTRYMDMVKPAGRSPAGLEQWLQTDAENDEVRAAGIIREPTLPVQQDVPALVDDCATCRGKRWVRRDLPISLADFGKALRCPSCGGHPTGNSPTTPAQPERLDCWKCGRFQDERAGERCSNPKWHDPNWRTGDYPKTKPVAGWTTVSDNVRDT